MSGKLVAILVVGMALGFGLASWGKFSQAQAPPQQTQRPLAQPVTLEFKVVTMSGSDEDIAKQLSTLAGAGWQFVGMVNANKGNTAGAPSQVAFVRPKR